MVDYDALFLTPQTDRNLIERLWVNRPEGMVSLKLYRTSEPTLALAVWRDHDTLEIREQIVDVPNTASWRSTACRKMRELELPSHIPAVLIPRPNKKRAPYALNV